MADNKNSKDSFEQARDRYKQRNNTTKTIENKPSNNQTDGNIKDYIDSAVERFDSKALAPLIKVKTSANDNVKLTLPVPLPVRPIEPELIAASMRTNELLNQVKKAINQNTIKDPLKIDDSQLAHESTLIKVVDILHFILIEINKTFAMSTKQLTETTKKFVAGIGVMEALDEKTSGSTSKWFSKISDYFKGVNNKFFSIVEGFGLAITPLTITSKHTLEYIKGLYTLQKKRFDYDQQNMQQGDTENIRRLLESQRKKGILESASNMLFPKEMKEFIDKIGKFFGKQSVEGADKLQAMMGKYAPLLAPIISGLRLVPLFLELFGGLAGLITSIVGLGIFASMYAMVKHPEQFTGMMEAFGRLFADVIKPTFIWISKEIVPVLSAAFAGLMVAGQDLLDSIGTNINESLIWLIGTAIPEVFTLLGHYINTAWQTIKQEIKHIAGIFGYGEYKDKSLVDNLIGIPMAFADGLTKIADETLTTLIRWLDMTDVFGMKKDESFFGRIKRFFMEDIPNFTYKLIDDIVNGIKKIVPIGTIKQKLNDLVDGIVKMIPTWDDLRKFVIDAIPDWVGSDIKQWFEKQLGAPAQQPVPVTRDVQPTVDTPMSPFQKQSNVTVFAPSTFSRNQNNIVNGGGKMPLGVGSTRPENNRLDDMIYKAIPY